MRRCCRSPRPSADRAGRLDRRRALHQLRGEPGAGECGGVASGPRSGSGSTPAGCNATTASARESCSTRRVPLSSSNTTRAKRLGFARRLAPRASHRSCGSAHAACVHSSGAPAGASRVARPPPPGLRPTSAVRIGEVTTERRVQRPHARDDRADERGAGDTRRILDLGKFWHGGVRPPRPSCASTARGQTTRSESNRGRCA